MGRKLGDMLRRRWIKRKVERVETEESSESDFDFLERLSDGDGVLDVDVWGRVSIESSPLLQVQHSINDYNPVLDAWNSVQQQPTFLFEACKTVIKSKNTKRSLDEWCLAHNLLMQAVRMGIIPRSRDFNGKELYWHHQLYVHCDKLAIGQKDVDLLISLFREAEDLGVIAQGTAEAFSFAIRIRKDIEEDKWCSANAIYQLFMRQAETDARLYKVLHYQKVQQLTSLINAVLGLVPIGGAVAANVVSGGAAILNDFQVCGLFESLMGVGKELSGGFGSSKLVDLFLRRSNDVLSEDRWDEWREEDRKAVEDAARNLRLTVPELRDRLLRAAEMMIDREANNEEEDETVMKVMEGNRVDNRSKDETNVIEILGSSAFVSNVEMIRSEDTRFNDRQGACLEDNDVEVVVRVEEKELTTSQEDQHVELKLKMVLNLSLRMPKRVN